MIYKFYNFFLGQGCTKTRPRCSVGASFLGSVKTFGARWAWQANSSQATPPIFNDIASYPLIKNNKILKAAWRVNHTH